MKRQDMEEQILLHVPRLAEEEKDRWKNAEKLRKDFVRGFSPAKIGEMQLDDFVIGKGSKNRSFCYRLEREMDDLGRILGATAYKFGVYYGKEGNDLSLHYRFKPKWGNSREEAFSFVKSEIVALLQSASLKDMDALNNNLLSPMFKGKLLFVYHPEEYAPIYSKEHLNYFVAELNLHANPKSTVEMQRALMSYRTTWPVLMEHSAVLYMHFLYQIFPQVKTPSTPEEKTLSMPQAKTPPLPLLDLAINGASFIDQMPPISLPKENKRSVDKIAPKIDYIEQQRQRKRIGNRGEAIVFSMEEQRLKEEGRPDLVKNMQHASDKSDKEGYDIVSYDMDGSPRYIEVKATSAGNLDRGFYISSNELEKSKSLPNYYIYIVFAATSKAPKILPIKEPKLLDAEYSLEPMSYHVTINPRNQEPVNG